MMGIPHLVRLLRASIAKALLVRHGPMTINGAFLFLVDS
jgi:hypothetical protein